MITRKKYDLEDRLIDFAVLICKIANRLPSNRVSHHVVGQIIRSSTAPAANYGEAQAAESRKDFVHKMKLCLKELRETKVWIKFVRQMQLYDPSKIQKALNESNELIAIFSKSIQTAQNK